MSTLGIINSDPEIRKKIEFAFAQSPGNNYDVIFLSEEDKILDFLNYALPELVVINFSDPSLDVENVVGHIRNDKWILNFGIIGLFDNKKDREEALLKKFKAINVLTLLDNFRLRSHLVKNIEIIEQNYQIIFQREFTKNLLDGASGSFTIENDLLAVPLYSGIGATILAQRGLINPDSKMHLQLALAELVVNAIEHGNCGISYEEKTQALNEGVSPIDLIAEKCKDPAIKARKVNFLWEIKSDYSAFIIQDQGKGFDVKAHLAKIARQDQYSLHGRGIKLAASLSQELKYNARGNQVALIIRHDVSVEHEVPVGFSREQILAVKKGDIVLREGEPSDYLYYISSGTYEVYQGDKPVGTLSAQDIFMGEMAFLLNQRRSATVKAATSGKLILLTQKTFINVIREYPHYGIFLSKLLAKRLVRSNEQTAQRLSRHNDTPAAPCHGPPGLI
ncbi:MAG: cyclic nucleotide-binding domain-containing protein [Treponema sp.]|jgi:anti-sigma regulatory factor (Ser/Thr protein kinase)|nr:cyclic nucleotide-binding domain-containing protein [Treponema sp.]